MNESRRTFVCDAILFDLDGVLVDSRECVERTWRQWAAERGLDPELVLREAHGRRTFETIQRVAPHLDAAAEGARIAASESGETRGIYEIIGARELLASLPPRSWAIVTSGIRAVAETRIRHMRLPTPPVLVPADEITHGKPHPEGYLTAARRLGIEPARCIVIEDAPPGIEAARAADMRAIGVLGTYPIDALSAADVVIPSVAAMRVTPRDGSLEIVVHRRHIE
jgi:mannitol-1-/sugar-/sorbitol-6-phosphatase